MRPAVLPLQTVNPEKARHALDPKRLTDYIFEVLLKAKFENLSR